MSPRQTVCSLLLSTLCGLGVVASITGCVSPDPNHTIDPGDEGSTDGAGGKGSNTTSSKASTTGGSTTDTSSSTGAGGDGGSGDGGGSASGSFAISVSNSHPTSDIFADTKIDVTITPSGGFTGSVSLVSSNLLEGVSATFDDMSPTIDTDPVTVHMTIHVDSGSTVGDSMFQVSGGSGGLSKSTPVTLTVNPKITVHIPAGVSGHGQSAGMPYKTAYGPYPIVIHSSDMITLTFMNDDGAAHVIHGSGTFGHDPDTGAPNGGGAPAHTLDPYVRHLPPGQYDWYLHEEGASKTPGQMIIMTP